jgi:hypothetical protein
MQTASAYEDFVNSCSNSADQRSVIVDRRRLEADRSAIGPTQSVVTRTFAPHALTGCSTPKGEDSTDLARDPAIYGNKSCKAMPISRPRRVWGVGFGVWVSLGFRFGVMGLALGVRDAGDSQAPPTPNTKPGTPDRNATPTRTPDPPP